MARLLLLFNHRLTFDQEKAAREELKITDVIVPPQELQQLWSAIPPDADDLKPILQPIIAWIEAEGSRDDYVLIQGDFGACYLLVRDALSRGMVPVYSTTARLAREHFLDDGSIQMEHTFKHVRFRNYSR